jgi:NitT/TauT family transport system permease protein
MRLSGLAARSLSLLAARSLSLLALLVLWDGAARLAASRTLPSPVEVFAFVIDETLHGDLLFNLGMTLWRVAAAFAVAMAIGSAIGIALGRWKRANLAFDTWVVVALNLPALVIAILCYIWLGLTETAAITAVALNKIPNVVVVLREGARTIDRDLEEMALVYRFSFGTWLRHVLLPQLAPYFTVASRSGLALVWKIVLVVELLGRPNGVGYAMSVYFQLFDVRGVLGYAFAFTAVMLLIEYVVLQPLEAHARRWRPAAA